jgi:hypothetical protein
MLKRNHYRTVVRVTLSICMIAIGILADTKTGAAQDGQASTQQAGQQQILFDGQDLSDWNGDEKFWRVEDNVIVGESTAENPVKQNTFLIYNKEKFDDFELSLKFKISNGNSGIQYRSEVFDETNYRVRGYQADIDPTMRYMGILYEEGGRGILAERGQSVIIADDGKRETKDLETDKKIRESIKAGQWNEYVVIAKGNSITQKINGIVSVELIDNQSAKAKSTGYLALQLHTGPPMKVEFKDIKITNLKKSDR